MSTSLYKRITLPKNIIKTDIVAPKTYRGFSTISNKTDNFSLYDFELIKQDLFNNFHVRQGERLMQPKFGTIIWDLLFEPLTEDVKMLIKQDVESIINYDPRVQISDTSITSYESGIEISFVLSYSVYNITEQIQLRFDQDNGIA